MMYRGVTFAYPGSKENVKALRGISLSIKPGQLVIVVGANGSGKSTIVKMLSRLYDPESGEILVDGQPIQQYQLSDLRVATATLTQDHLIYPLSLTENIGLGHPDLVSDMDLVVQASKQGGAYDCISKLANGFETFLGRSSEAYGVNLSSEPTDPLQKELEKLQKEVDISGGERQRVVAYALFLSVSHSN
jgi:ABC-type multidrug transport system fused ATPase/permease subunit